MFETVMHYIEKHLVLSVIGAAIVGGSILVVFLPVLLRKSKQGLQFFAAQIRSRRRAPVLASQPVLPRVRKDTDVIAGETAQLIYEEAMRRFQEALSSEPLKAAVKALEETTSQLVAHHEVVAKHRTEAEAIKEKLEIVLSMFRKAAGVPEVIKPEVSQVVTSTSSETETKLVCEPPAQ